MARSGEVSGERSSPFEAFLRNDRAFTLLALAAIIALSAWVMLASGHSLMLAPAGSAGSVLLLFVMWWTMMMAMMLPSAAPAILTFAAMSRKLSRSHRQHIGIKRRSSQATSRCGQGLLSSRSRRICCSPDFR